MAHAWTREMVLALAPDAASAQAGQSLASPRTWKGLGRDDRAIWGECQGSGKNPYQARADLGGAGAGAAAAAFKCTCPSRKFPCKHALGLLLLMVERSDLVATGPRPAWVAEWLASREGRQEKKAAKAEAETFKPVDAEAQAKRQAKREANVSAGIEGLALWMRDLIRAGLAAARSKPGSFWETQAARLVDAQAPGLARMVRELAATVSSGEGWEGRTLERLGRLHLLGRALARIDRLPRDVQAEVRSLVGWTVTKEEVLAGAGVKDHWVVLGQRTYQEDRVRVQRTWAWGASSARPALFLAFAAPGGQNLPAEFVPGTSFDAELAFYPGATPVRALVKERGETGAAPPEPPGYASIATAGASFAEAVGRNPWTEQWCLPLRSVVPVRAGGQDSWLVRDPEGASLPLIRGFDRGWELLAVSGGRSVSVVGEFDGVALRPLSVWAGGTCRSLAPKEEDP
jgi:hypothetical protein